MLNAPPALGRPDLRFTLYDCTTRETNTLFFDIDGCALRDAGCVVASIVEEVGEYRHHAVHSGGGVHVYFPLGDGITITKDDFPRYRKAYHALCLRIKNSIDAKGVVVEKVDKEVFKHMMLGRMPKSFNSRRSTHVRVIGTEHQDNLLDYRDILQEEELVDEVVRETLSALVIPEVVERECRAVQHFRDYPDEYRTRDPWFAIGQVFRGIGKLQEFVDTSAASKHADVEGIENLKRSNDYDFACRSIHKQYIDNKMESPCVGCAHNCVGSIPIFISGRFPTPSRRRGFMFTKTAKNGDKTYHIVPTDIVNDYFNLNESKLLYSPTSGEYFLYNGSCWEAQGKLATVGKGQGKSEVRRDMFGRIKKQLETRDKAAIDNTFRTFEHFPVVNEEQFDNVPAIVFNNCALVMEGDKLVERKLDSTLMNRTNIPCSYSPTAKAPIMEDYLKWCCDGDQAQIDILKIIMGLTISSLSPATVQKFFWLKGASGTGKSTFTEVLRLLAGDVNTAVLPRRITENPHAMPLLSGKLLLLGPDIRPSFMNSRGITTLLDYIRPLTGDEAVPEKKSGLNQTHINATCCVVLTSNEFFNQINRDTAMARRYVPIEFWKVPENVDRFIGDKLQKELPGIYNIAIEGLEMYMESELGAYDYQSLLDLSKEEDVDDTASFVYDRYTKGRERDIIYHDEIYRDYLDFAQLPDLGRGDRKALTHNIRRIFCEQNGLRVSLTAGRNNKGRYMKYIVRRGHEQRRDLEETKGQETTSGQGGDVQSEGDDVLGTSWL